MKKIILLLISILISVVGYGDVFDNKDTVFFVGGVGTKAGTNSAGGCTRAWYEANIASSGDLTEIMETNGACLQQHTGSTVDDDGGGVSVYIQETGGFSGVETGMCASIDFADTYDDGKYELQYISDDKVQILNLSYLGDTTADVCVGGAFEALDQAENSIDATSYSVWVLTNKDEELGLEMDFSNGGSVDNNTYVYFWGFNTTPPTNLFEPTGDMDYNETTKAAGTYYISSLGVAQNGSVPSGYKVIINGDDGTPLTHDMMDLNVSNTHFRNILFENLANGYDFIAYTSSYYQVSFNGCVFTGDYEYVTDGSASYSTLFNDCYFSASTNFNHIIFQLSTGQYGGLFYGCVFDLDTNIAVYAPYASFDNCIFIDGDYGLKFNITNVKNCTFYNQTIASIDVSATNRTGHMINNVIVPAVGASDHAVNIETSGSVGLFTNICYYGANGVSLSTPFERNGNAFTPFGGGNLAQDPKLADPSNNDYRLKYFSPCHNRGATILDETNSHSIGAWQRKSRF